MSYLPIEADNLVNEIGLAEFSRRSGVPLASLRQWRDEKYRPQKYCKGYKNLMKFLYKGKQHDQNDHPVLHESKRYKVTVDVSKSELERMIDCLMSNPSALSAISKALL